MKKASLKVLAKSRRMGCLMFAVVLLLVNAQQAVVACSTFTLMKDGHFVFGANVDWFVDSGLIVINQRNITKKATMILPAKNRKIDGLEWTSKYGSVTFNGLSREFPFEGMNEAGLVVENMWLDETKYPKPDARKEIDTLQWVQYLLDTCATVDDVLASLKTVRISKDGTSPLHFLIADRKGNTLAVDFIDGKAMTYTGKTLPHAVLTNSPYQQSIRYAQRFKGLGGNKSIRRGTDSLDRFVRIADAAKKFASKNVNIVEYSFDILHDVNFGYKPNSHATVWSIVYDITNLSISFRTNSNRSIRIINLEELDFSNGRPVRVWSILNDMKGDITKKSIPYSKELNHQTIVKQVTNPDVVKKVGEVGDIREVINHLSVYPEEFTHDYSEDGP